jgi:PAS domain S-box-containing protein
MVALALVLTSFAFVHDLYQSNRSVENAARRRMMAMGNLVVPALERSLSQNDRSEAEAEIARLLLIPDLTVAFVLDDLDRVFLGTDKGLHGQPLADTAAASVRPLVARARETRNAQSDLDPDRRSFHAVFPFPMGLLPGELRASRTAVLYTATDLENLKRAEMGTIQQRTLAMAGAALLACVGAWFYFHRTFSLRLSQIVAGVAAYASNRRRPNLPTEGGDELARIGQAVNRMALDIEAQDCALRASEARKAAILESTLDAIISLDSQAQVVDWNAAATRMFGYPSTEAIGHDLLELVIPERLRSVFRHDVDLTMNTGGNPAQSRQSMEWTTIRKDGSEFPVEASITVVSAESPLFTVVLRDLSERRLVEETLHRKDRLLREVIDLVPHFIFAKDRDGRYLFVNQATAAALGMETDQLVGKTDLELPRPQAESESLRRDDHEVFASGEHKVIPAEALIDVHGRTRYYQTTKIPFEDPVTRERALLGVAVDITDRMQAEEEHRREAEFRSAIIERASEGICVCHEIPEPPHVAFTVWNGLMTEITGYSISDINRIGWYQAMYPDPELRDRAIDRMSRMRRGEDLVGEEWTITRADGRIRVLAISTRAIHGPGGSPTSWPSCATSRSAGRRNSRSRKARNASVNWPKTSTRCSGSPPRTTASFSMSAQATNAFGVGRSGN